MVVCLLGGYAPEFVTICAGRHGNAFFFQAEDGIRYLIVTGVQTCALSISSRRRHTRSDRDWSSDVCSSDLLWIVATWFVEALDFAAILAILSVTKRCGKTHLLHLVKPVEIGRASCRERV